MPVAYNLASILAEDNKLCLEVGRLSTFDNRWPHKGYCSPENMAKAGFSYTGLSDCVKCHICHVKLDGWLPETETPREKHLELSPDCLFAQLGRDEDSLMVEQWCDLMCARAIRTVDNYLLGVNNLMGE